MIPDITSRSPRNRDDDPTVIVVLHRRVASRAGATCCERRHRLVANLMVAFPGAELAQPTRDGGEVCRPDYSPIPVEEKFPPLGGYTGWRGRWVDLDEAERLVRTHAGWNIALRLPEDAVGIDIDAYAGGLARSPLSGMSWARCRRRS